MRMGRSVKAFELLFSLSDKTLVKVRRDGEVKIIPQSEAVVGDVIILESGSKVVADGRLIKSEGLLIDESTLTGESAPREKNARAVVGQNAPLADRVNCVYAGTLITAGHGEMLVTAVGNQAEIGGIAGELQNKNKISAPLSEKLSRLSRLVTIIGGVAACLVFIISLSRLIVAGSVTFLSVQEIFIESIVLIVAAVPEGLPTIVAISLSLNVLKLAKENALIKKLVAAETAGCVSVICSDKTGTLTQNKMRVDAMSCAGMGGKIPDAVISNIIINSTVEFVQGGAENGLSGNPTERALIEYAKRLGEMRKAFTVIGREDFTSDRKYMSTKTHKMAFFVPIIRAR